MDRVERWCRVDSTWGSAAPQARAAGGGTRYAGAVPRSGDNEYGSRIAVRAQNAAAQRLRKSGRDDSSGR